ncbi:MAG: phytanoyl-CoA dioxygenase family protein [Planctomycetes bacterium]|nr:phytanoyl-CoA dioxygenase family protein [Planctomycetota bacterium]
MSRTPLSADQVAAFHRDGYVVCRGYFTSGEMARLIAHARGDDVLESRHLPITDAAGRLSKLTLWNDPGDDLYGMFSRCERVVGAMEQLLGGEVYHYHAKMMLKEPRVGGAWEWHQDYGYWYQNGCLLPDLASCMVAVDRATRANGCLQLLKGSQRMGRVEHGTFGTQTGADPERVSEAMKRFELIHFEAEAGDALFFHANTLHGSAPNTSEHPRWSLIMCYNTRANDPFKDSHHPRYTKLDIVPDAAILTR